MEGVGGAGIFAGGGELGRFGGAGYGGQRLARKARKWKFDVRRFFCMAEAVPWKKVPFLGFFFANELRRYAREKQIPRYASG